MKNDMIVLHEYKLEINLLNEYYKYCQKYRESFYRLNNLLGMYDSELYREELLEEANVQLEEFKKFDGWDNEENDDMSEVAFTLEEDTAKKMDSYKLFLDVDRAIRGKSKIDSVQYKILQEIYKTYEKANNLIMSEYPIESRRIRDERIKRTINYIKYDSHLRNRYDTFELKLDYKNLKAKEKIELQKELKAKGFSNPYYLCNIQNFDFLINEEIEKVEGEITDFLLAKDRIEDNKNVKIENRKNNLQFAFNIIVSISTILSLIVSILTYLYKD